MPVEVLKKSFNDLLRGSSPRDNAGFECAQLAVNGEYTVKGEGYVTEVQFTLLTGTQSGYQLQLDNSPLLPSQGEILTIGALGAEVGTISPGTGDVFTGTRAISSVPITLYHEKYEFNNREFPVSNGNILKLNRITGALAALCYFKIVHAQITKGKLASEELTDIV